MLTLTTLLTPLLGAWAGLAARIIPWLIGALLVVGGVWWLRHDAADDARQADRIQNLEQIEDANHAGNDAANDARREPVDERLRDGRF